ncbi:hypothetical protein BQ8420_02415 [Nocardiopsis sp. JB363]|nr:hypothetical protein BQ8420_02415 [Nocardiopsis sp. JB363]
MRDQIQHKDRTGGRHCRFERHRGSVGRRPLLGQGTVRHSLSL